MKKLVVALAAVVLASAMLFGAGAYAQTAAKNRLLPVYNVERTDNKCAISFDAAWGADKTRQIMDVCDRYNVKATFSLSDSGWTNIPKWCEKYTSAALKSARTATLIRK